MQKKKILQIVNIIKNKKMCFARAMGPLTPPQATEQDVCQTSQASLPAFHFTGINQPMFFPSCSEGSKCSTPPPPTPAQPHCTPDVPSPVSLISQNWSLRGPYPTSPARPRGRYQ